MSRTNLWALLGAIVAAGVLFMSIVGFMTLLDVANAQANHTGTLNAIRAVSQQNHNLGKQNHQLLQRVTDDETALKNATVIVDQVLMEAGTTSKSLLSSMHELCAAQHLTC